MNIDQLLNTLSNLKYTQRLNKPTFSQLFFPNSTDDDFLKGQWYSFATDPLRFLWTLSGQELELLCQYVSQQKYGDSQRRYKGGDQ